ncbi:hypothetical protein AWC38_SpisGene24260 [Stylophora pistillata]|uniref:Uncharacterized protein n=1 Tax=Stylophora pistillata TaxID=50429 RepID=A0A2B4R0E7_STYPI|nr:hypothetical protein AWC38_SpisGene24260 [Stylophora pistillata]
MEVVRPFEERSEEMGRRSMMKDAKKYASEFGLNLPLVHLQPLITCLTNDLKVPVKKIGMWLKTAVKERDVEELKAEGWQGRLLTERWEDQEVGYECFSWMSEWKTAPTHTIAGLQELYQQLLQTKVYHQKKTGTHTSEDNAAVRNTPKPLCENRTGKALWDMPPYAEHAEVRNNRTDCTVIDKERKKVVLVEMSCPWVSNREVKCAEKTNKYALLRYELSRRYPGYKIEQHNNIIDALGGSSRRVKESIRQLVGIG